MPINLGPHVLLAPRTSNEHSPGIDTLDGFVGRHWLTRGGLDTILCSFDDVVPRFRIQSGDRCRPGLGLLTPGASVEFWNREFVLLTELAPVFEVTTVPDRKCSLNLKVKPQNRQRDGRLIQRTAVTASVSAPRGLFVSKFFSPLTTIALVV